MTQNENDDDPLASHVDKLERAGYVEMHTSLNGKIPRTEYSLTGSGRLGLEQYWAALDQIRAASGQATRRIR